MLAQRLSRPSRLSSSSNGSASDFNSAGSRHSSAYYVQSQRWLFSAAMLHENAATSAPLLEPRPVVIPEEKPCPLLSHQRKWSHAAHRHTVAVGPSIAGGVWAACPTRPNPLLPALSHSASFLAHHLQHAQIWQSSGPQHCALHTSRCPALVPMAAAKFW